jgi:hypothetical protein
MDTHCDAGKATTDHIGDLPGYGVVWYHPSDIANILSLAHMHKKGYHVTYKSQTNNVLTVHKPDGSNCTFCQSPCSLFYMDMAPDDPSVSLLNTVAENRAFYTNRDYSHAVLDRQVQHIIGQTSTCAFLDILNWKLLPNCPVTHDNVLAAKHISGHDLSPSKQTCLTPNQSKSR